MTSTPTSVTIVGAGLAGAKTAEELRTVGFDGSITLLGREEHRPYERPPLSKTNLLKGSVADGDLYVHDPTWYSEHDVDLRLGSFVDSVDLDAGSLTVTAGGTTDAIPFDALVLATGSSPRRLDVPGAELRGVQYLRTLDDSNALRAALVDRPRVVLIGGGWIGLEVAAAAATLGGSVTVLEASGMPLGSALGERMASVLVDAHRAHGVDVRTNVEVKGFISDGASHLGGAGHVKGVALGDGSQVAADVVVVGVGATPNVELAQAMGLDVDNGVLTDEYLRTSHPAVLAVGDIANAWHPTLETRIRVEHWANALNQPKALAESIIGRRTAYDRLPYFYSDQYGLGLEYTGHVAWGDVTELVVRGEESSGEFMAFWLRDGRVAAGLCVNVWDQMEEVQALIRSRAEVGAGPLSDPDIPLGEVARNARMVR